MGLYYNHNKDERERASLFDAREDANKSVSGKGLCEEGGHVPKETNN